MSLSGTEPGESPAPGVLGPSKASQRPSAAFHRGAGARFARPKSLYVKATGVTDDDKDIVIEMYLKAVDPDYSEISIDLESITVDDESNGIYIKQTATGEYNASIDFTRCRRGDPNDR